MNLLFGNLLLVALGGAAGSVCRYLAAVYFGAGALTTFCVNVSGAFLIGVIAGIVPVLDPRLRLLLATGFLGGYTTFSAWQLEALLEMRSGHVMTAAAILFISLLAGFVAVATGFAIGSRLR